MKRVAAISVWLVFALLLVSCQSLRVSKSIEFTYETSEGPNFTAHAPRAIYTVLPYHKNPSGEDAIYVKLLARIMAADGYTVKSAAQLEETAVDGVVYHNRPVVLRTLVSGDHTAVMIEVWNMETKCSHGTLRTQSKLTKGWSGMFVVRSAAFQRNADLLLEHFIGLYGTSVARATERVTLP